MQVQIDFKCKPDMPDARNAFGVNATQQMSHFSEKSFKNQISFDFKRKNNQWFISLAYLKSGENCMDEVKIT